MVTLIKPPAFRKDAVPVAEGWKNPHTEEIVLFEKFTDEEINAFYEAKNTVKGVTTVPTVDLAAQVETVTITQEPVIEVEPEVTLTATVDTEEPIEVDGSLHEMSKRELENLGRQHGLELDRRRSKAVLVEELTDHMEMKPIEDLSKLEMEAIGRRYGIELDRRKNKETLLEELDDIRAKAAPV